MTTPGGDRIVGHDGRWWSLLRWLEGDQPERGSHTNEQAAAMGEMLARIHVVLQRVPSGANQRPPAETTLDKIRRANELLSLLERHQNPGEDEALAAAWLAAQRDWLQSRIGDPPPAPTNRQTIHGDYHDANIVFRAHLVAGVIDWDKAEAGDPLGEVVGAVHLSFQLDPLRCQGFVAGYRSISAVTVDKLDAAARNYGFHRDRSLWFFEELYRRGNERLRPFLNRRPFVPFEVSWETIRTDL